jgi:FkbM family methyltransferase
MLEKAPHKAPHWQLDENNEYHGKQALTILNHLREKPLDRNDLVQFMAFAMTHAPFTTSQLFQDLWALWMNGEKRGGYFVEFGAADGVKLSNSYYLERAFRWNGIVAEPHPRFFERATQNRRCHVSERCVYSRSDEILTFNVAQKGELSRLDIINPRDGHEARRDADAVATQVRTISLNDLLTLYKAPRRIDYMSVDTEGSELEILEAFDFDRWKVRAFTVEHNHTPAEAKLDALFAARGYRRMFPRISRFDAWYVRG